MNKLVILTTLAVVMLAQLPALRCSVLDPRHCVAQFALATQSCSVVFPRRANSQVDQAELNHGEDHRHEEHDHEEHDHEEHHHEEHHHGHHDHDEHSAYDECCKWLNELDPVCVCSQLVRLPVFLAKLRHAIVIAVSDSCKVSFECGSA